MFSRFVVSILTLDSTKPILKKKVLNSHFRRNGFMGHCLLKRKASVDHVVQCIFEKLICKDNRPSSKLGYEALGNS